MGERLMPYQWDFSIVWRNQDVFVNGALVTLQLTFFAITLGTLWGFLLGLSRLSKFKILRAFTSLYIEIFLALPVLVLLIWIYYSGPLLFRFLNISNFWTAVLALALSLGAFVAEIVRSGIEAVPRGQVEAARGMGMTFLQATRKIVVPQAFRVMTPPLLGQYITCLKLSSLASVIAVYELLHSAQNLITYTYRPLEIYTAVALTYVVLIFPFSLLTRRLEASKKWRMV